MLLRIHEANPTERQIRQVVNILNNDGVIIYPTDTVYGLGCSILNPKAVERISKIKGIPLSKANFSLICSNLSDLSTYAKPINNNIYRAMKKCLPGPYTFILKASNNVPKLFMSKKKTVGIRVPDNKIVQAILKELGHPIMSTSIKNDEDNFIEYITDPELIYEKFEKQVDLVIHGDYGGIEASTILDCTEDEIIIIREGKGKIDFL